MMTGPMGKMERGTLTLAPGPSNNLRSETSAAPAAVAAVDATAPATAASQMMVAEAAVGLMVVQVED
jgi:hypothetical protein